MRENDHREALELIGYGLAKFAGGEKGKNLFANMLAANRNAFFKLLVEKGIAKSTNVVSTMQDRYDPLFENAKQGFKKEDEVKRQKRIKTSIDSVIGYLSIGEYVEFTRALIEYECAGETTKENIELISLAKKAVSDERKHSGNATNKLENISDGNNLLDGKESKSEGRKHTKIQWQLIQLGLKLGCEVYVAQNDRKRVYQGRQLGEYCLEKLPKLGLNEEVINIIKWIDVVWIKDGAVKGAFEVECTTSIYSGILRLSDLFYSVPNLLIQGYIVVPVQRERQVNRELQRPTFKGVIDRIQYWTDDDLFDFFEKVKKFPNGSIDFIALNSINHS